MPQHRNNPGDGSSGPRKPFKGKPRPGGFRPGGPRFDGPRPDGQRFDGPRADGPRFQGPRSFGPRPSGRPGGFEGRGGYSSDGPRQDSPRADGPIPYRGPGGQRSFGPRPSGRTDGGDWTPRSGGSGYGQGGARPGGPRPGGFGQAGPRPGGFRGPRSDSPRPGGFGPGGSRPDFDAGSDQSGAPRASRREWQPTDARTPQPPRPRGGFGARPGFGGPRPGFGPRSGFAPQRPAGDEGGFGEGQRADFDRNAPGQGGEFRPAPRPYARPGGFAGPRRSGHPGARSGFGFGGGRPDDTTRAPEIRDVDALDDASPLEPGDFADTGAAAGAAATPEFEAPDTREETVQRPPRPMGRPSLRPDFRARSGGYQERRPYGQGGAAAPWARTPSGPAASELMGEGEELVAGRHPVEEAFIAHRKAIRLLVVPQRRLALEKLVLHATNLRIPIVEVEGGTLTSLAGFDGHQGIALVTDQRKFAGLDDILARAIERKEAPFVLVLDSLEDPQNFGSLLRTAEASGVHGVIYPVRRQAPLSAAAVKASAGAVEHLLMVPVDDLAEALTDLHVRGLRVIGSDADASLTARQADLRGPVVVVVGSEGQGLGPAVRRRCDTVVRIPMRGRVSSLNAAVAGSILLYEASSQRGGERPLIKPESGDEADLELRSGPEGADDYTPEPEPATPIATLGEAGAVADPEPEREADPEAELAPKAKPRRKSAAPKPAASNAGERVEPDEDALLPGAPVIDPGEGGSAG